MEGQAREAGEVETDVARALRGTAEEILEFAGLASLAAEGNVGVRAHVSATLAQIADFHRRLTSGCDVVGWSSDDEELLVTQGRRSIAMARFFEETLLPRYPQLERRFKSGQGSFLDAGAGVGHLSSAICDRFPSARCVAIEPRSRPLELARGILADARSAGRAELIETSLEDFRAEGEFDVAWVPLEFIDAGVVHAALASTHRALSAGGVIFVSIPPDEPDLSAACARFRSIVWGGRPMSAAETANMLRRVGFVHVEGQRFSSSVTILDAQKATIGASG